MAKSTGIIRAEVRHRMSAAIAAGKSASRFLTEMKTAGLGYRRTTFLADWRTIGNIKEKEGLLKYVRKDRVPSPRLFAETADRYSREYIYIMNVKTRLAPGEPIESQLVSIQSDRQLTPAEMESEVYEDWGGWYPERMDQIVVVIPETPIHGPAR